MQNNFASPDLIDPKKPFPGFSLIAKDSCGEGGKNYFKIEDQIELDFYSKKLPNALIISLLNLVQLHVPLKA